MENDQLKSKPPGVSRVEARYIVLPQHANDVGIAFGGTLMSWIDMVATIVAQKHCEHKVVTVSTDRINFLAPIAIGDHVLLKAAVNFVGHTSMEIGVQVTQENPFTGETRLATTAYLTFVGIGADKRPVAIPGLAPETPEERLRCEAGRRRMEERRAARHAGD